MLLARIYYRLKPFVPRGFRYAVKRLHARRILKRCGGTWPIDEAASVKPPGWPGWPEGKPFAFVLTHDVESQRGVERVKQLAEVEMEFGFRSSFNLIPEGGYKVPHELRSWLTERGFEVGVHDLHHDGKLYWERSDFRRKAGRINSYLKDWNAVGFRSGFMFRNLDWIQDLDVSYDGSTFDTDPFEPQPDGAGTIFPFWVAKRGTGKSSAVSLNGSATHAMQAAALPAMPVNKTEDGYVELPYTLPQDSTLFLLLQEKTSERWIKKLDWVAERGGMAMLIVHPDYIQFEGEPPSRDTFPVERYRELLRHVRDTYREGYWHALPREVAAFARDAVVKRAEPVAANGSAPASGPRPRRTAAAEKGKIWIDLDNTPHVPFFEPIIDELKSRGFQLLVTARDAFQVCELADKKGVEYVKVGRHYGKNRAAKAAGLVYRALQLAPVVLRERPLLGVSHGARSQLILGNLFRIPTVLLEDYEYCQFPPMMKPTWIMAPEVIPDESLPLKNGHVRKYQGIKEDVYAWKLRPDASLYEELGLEASDLIVTVRPPATEAHYHNPESERLFERFMHRASQTPGVRVVLLPRNQKQGTAIKEQNPEWFADRRTVIPARALDGLNLLWHSDLVVSGGGTMNREAAALGVPVFSTFRGTIGAVDHQLSAEGRLILVESVEDVDRKIPLVKRERRDVGEVTSTRTLERIVDTIQEIAELSRR